MEADRIAVFVLEQEPGGLTSLAGRLLEEGFSGAARGGVEDFRATWAKNPNQVVIIDLGQGADSGLSLLEEIRSQSSGAEVILLTGRLDAQKAVQGLRQGAFDYLTRPFELEHLTEKIHQAADKIGRAGEEAREEERRAKMEQRMRAAERLASLGTLAAGVAHEINNPLAIISESVGWIKSKVARDESVSEELRSDIDRAVEKVETGVERARRITHQLINTTVQPETRIKEFHLDALAAEVVELTFKMAQDARVDVFWRVESGETVIWSDSFQVRQVLINLVNNAIQAVGSGGQVEILVKGDPETVVIQVQDNGPGVPPENLERIFEPFFSTKPPGQGTGLGLSVSRGIAENLGGGLSVESQLGRGATFSLTLPRFTEPPEDKAGAEQS